MTLFVGPGQKRLDGHKDLTAHQTLLETHCDEIAIALAHGATPMECCVNVGDKVKIGDLIGKRDDHFYVPLFASVSGTVKAIEKRPGTNMKPVDHVIIENDGLDTKAELSTLDYEKATKEEIIAFIKEKGIIGCGGAAFPTYFKYQTDKCTDLIINCVECEPYITSDYCGITLYGDDLKRGVRALFKASGATKCHLGIKEDKKDAIRILNDLFKNDEHIVVAPLKDRYPMGWERTLLYSVLGKRYERLPIEAGAIISNSTTAIMVGKALDTGLPIYERIVTVSGDGVKQPRNVKCRVGTPINELTSLCGGYTAEKLSLLAGGPMMGAALTKDSVSVTPATNAITALIYQEIDEIACLRCGKCVENCPSGLQPVNIANAFKAGDADRMIKLSAVDCVECGMCTYVCPSYIHVTENVRKAKRLIMARNKK